MNGAPHPAGPPEILQFFDYAHLPPFLQAVSAPFGALANQIVAELPGCAERTVALRKLLESKDAAVRTVVQALNQDRAKASAAAADGTRKPGIQDLPPGQQKQLDEGKPIAPAKDPGSADLEQGQGATEGGDPVDRAANAPRAAADAPGRPADDDGGRTPGAAQVQPGPTT